MRSLDPTTLALLALLGCGGGSRAYGSGPGPDAGQDAAPVSDGATDGAADASDDEPQALDTGVVDEAGDATGEAGATCAGLGAACTSSASCFCGLAAGCTDDNVTCSDSGRCAVVQLPIVDGGETPIEQCCAACEYTYDTGGTMSAWLACNLACGPGACPVTCLAEVTGP